LVPISEYTISNRFIVSLRSLRDLFVLQLEKTERFLRTCLKYLAGAKFVTTSKYSTTTLYKLSVILERQGHICLSVAQYKVLSCGSTTLLRDRSCPK